MDSSFFSVIEKINLNFEHPKESSLFFKKRLTDSSLVFFFWSKKASAIIPTDIFVKSWDDFFILVMKQVFFLLPIGIK